jgi:hypothetical protein
MTISRSGPLGEVEDRLVGEVGHGVEARHGRGGGARAGGEDGAAGADGDAVGLDLEGAGEAGGSLDHPHAQGLEALDAVVGGDAGDHAADVLSNGG